MCVARGSLAPTCTHLSLLVYNLLGTKLNPVCRSSITFLHLIMSFTLDSFCSGLRTGLFRSQFDILNGKEMEGSNGWLESGRFCLSIHFSSRIRLSKKYKKVSRHPSVAYQKHEVSSVDLNMDLSANHKFGLINQSEKSDIS